MSESKNALAPGLAPHAMSNESIANPEDPAECTDGNKLVDTAELEMVQHQSLGCFLYDTNSANVLVIDKTTGDWPASIAATSFALAVYPVAVERGLMSRAAAVE